MSLSQVVIAFAVFLLLQPVPEPFRFRYEGKT